MNETIEIGTKNAKSQSKGLDVKMISVITNIKPARTIKADETFWWWYERDALILSLKLGPES